MVLVLLGTDRPIPLQRIADLVPGYPPAGDARRQAFERDKRTLREEGIPVAAEPVAGPEQVGYRIRPEDYYLPELGLTSDEQTALNVALGAIHLGDTAVAPARDALWRLGMPAISNPRPLAEIPVLEPLPVLHQAIRSRARTSFSYLGEQREVDPSTLWFKGGHWYLVGHDHMRGAMRTFRVDRIEGLPALGEAGSAAKHAADSAEVVPPTEPWRFGGGDPVQAVIRVDAVEAGRVVDAVGGSRVVARHDDGSVEIALEVTNPPALESFVLGLGRHGELLRPEEARASLVARLKLMSGVGEDGGSGGSGGARGSAGARGSGGDGGSGEGGGGEGGVVGEVGAGAQPGLAGDKRASSGSAGAGERLRRLLAVLTELARRGHAPIAELALHFGTSPADLVADLELAACCGRPPYTPDQLMEIIVDEDEVTANLGPELSRSRRLSPGEGFALAAAARTILAVPGADPAGTLASAVAKLDTALAARSDGSARPSNPQGASGEQGTSGEPGSSIVVNIDQPPLLDIVRAAHESRNQLDMTYHSASSDEVTNRVVDPLDLVAIDGHWYLDAWCHTAKSERRFRVDRIVDARITGAGRGGSGQGGGGQAREEGRLTAQREARAFVPGPDAVIVTLRAPNEVLLRLDGVPLLGVEAIEEGQVEVKLAVSGLGWFHRLLLRIGTKVTIYSPEDLIDAQVQAAKRVLELYEPPEPPEPAEPPEPPGRPGRPGRQNGQVLRGAG